MSSGSFHVSKNGEIKQCYAKIKCRLNSINFTSTIAAENYKKEEINKSIEIYDDNVNSNLIDEQNIYNEEQAIQRYKVLSWKVAECVKNKEDTKSLYYDVTENEWNKDRQVLHKQIIDGLMDKYNHVPKESKVVFSAGLPGAGKTTVLKKYENYHIDEYATISADDIKEIMAKEGMIPKIEGLTPMESSELIHEESSYLADILLNELSSKSTNIIYDFTCSSYDSANKRIKVLRANKYLTEDMQFVFVDIPLKIAKQRAIDRYVNGLNEGVRNDIRIKDLSDEEKMIKDNITLGGRYFPEEIIIKSKPENKVYHSKNAEIIVQLFNNPKLKFPPLITYDNSGKNPIKSKLYKIIKK